MSADELRAVASEVRKLKLAMREIPTRRFEAARVGERVDLRAMLRDVASKGPDHMLLRMKQRRWRRPPLVVLCDISGSMEAYARVFLHLLYALTNARERVHCFVFGTRLHNITRDLQNRDPGCGPGQNRHRDYGLVRRHPYRLVSGRVRPAVGAPRSRPERRKCCCLPTGSIAMAATASTSSCAGCARHADASFWVNPLDAL